MGTDYEYNTYPMEELPRIRKLLETQDTAFYNETYQFQELKLRSRRNHLISSFIPGNRDMVGILTFEQILDAIQELADMLHSCEKTEHGMDMILDSLRAFSKVALDCQEGYSFAVISFG